MTSTPTSWGLLKQPYKQESATPGNRVKVARLLPTDSSPPAHRNEAAGPL